MGTRLGLGGTSRTFSIATRSAALVAAGAAAVSLASDTAEVSGALSSSGVAAVSFAASSTAASSFTIVGQSIPALAGATISSGVLVSAGTSSFDGRSTTGVTALSLSGTPGKRKFPTSHSASTARFWQVNETLGINLGISDFSSRHFYLVDSLGINFEPNAFYGASAIVSAGSSTASFVGSSIGAGALDAPGTSTPSFEGAGVDIHSGDFALTGFATVSFQGTEAGTVFGVGILASAGVSTNAFGGSSTHEASWTIAGSSTPSLLAETIASGDFASAGSAEVEFFQSDNAAFSSAGSAAVAFTSEVIAASALSSQGTSVLSFVAQLPTPAPARRNRVHVIDKVERAPLAKKVRRDRVA